MIKRSTISERLCPSVDASTIASAWNDALIEKILLMVWQAYDDLSEDALAKVDCSQDSDDLEREVTELLYSRILKFWDASLSVHPGHAFAERESRKPSPAQPPLYDIAFVWTANSRLCWPLEAKVIGDDRDLKGNWGDYVKTFSTRFMTHYYAPFSPSALMMGYLRTGDPSKALDHIAAHIGKMIPHPQFLTRVHRISDHTRPIKQGKPYPAEFRCHHLMMPLSLDKSL